MAARTLEAVEMTNDEVTRFNSLRDRSYQKVLNTALRLSRNPSDAEDLTSEAYMRAFRSFRDYEGDRPFENWILRIVSRLFLDLNRSRKRRVQTVSSDAPLPGSNGDENLYFETPDSTNDPEVVLMRKNFDEHLQNALGALNEEQRLLITLADVEELPYQEIAEILGRPVGTIRSRLHRTHKLLQARIESSQRDEARNAEPAHRGFRMRMAH